MRDYRRLVVDYLLDGYARGLTPNPDVRCNREIKFGVFRAYARAEGFAAVATGHYARRVETGRAGPPGPPPTSPEADPASAPSTAALPPIAGPALAPAATGRALCWPAELGAPQNTGCGRPGGPSLPATTDA